MTKKNETKIRIRKNRSSILALILVGLLVFLYFFTLVTAFLQIPHWDKLFAACLVATIGIPILLWIYKMMVQRAKESSAAEEPAASDSTHSAKD